MTSRSRSHPLFCLLCMISGLDTRLLYVQLYSVRPPSLGCLHPAIHLPFARQRASPGLDAIAISSPATHAWHETQLPHPVMGQSATLPFLPHSQFCHTSPRLRVFTLVVLAASALFSPPWPFRRLSCSDASIGWDIPRLGSSLCRRKREHDIIPVVDTRL